MKSKGVLSNTGAIWLLLYACIYGYNTTNLTTYYLVTLISLSNLLLYGYWLWLYSVSNDCDEMIAVMNANNGIMAYYPEWWCDLLIG